ncbi:cytochrome P450 [Boletus reticuloceps]|uniref:Cytochrome P450 n=1 Tax=Boletus reticuloceps TaxID=495285 RepID=A0A8I2YZ67_9AGAM|nr:cytochrome P450 [Boletus reticuloceps]
MSCKRCERQLQQKSNCSFRSDRYFDNAGTAAELCIYYYLPATVSGVTCGAIGLVAAITLVSKLSHGPNLDAIPAVGSSGWLGSWWAGIKYLTNAQSVIQEGYEKYKFQGAPFKVAGPNSWTVFLSSREHVDELARATNVFSLSDATNDQIQIEYLLGRDVYLNPYHVGVISLRLIRNLEALYPDIRDEIVTSFTEFLDLRGNEWKSVSPLSIVQKVACRTSNRVFVGLPLCRDPDWINLNIQCTADVIAGGVIIGLFPKFMRPLASRLLTKVPQCLRRGETLVGPMIKERLRYLDQYGREWDNKPNDLLSWLMDEAEDAELTMERLSTRVLTVNFAAIHGFTQALIYLAANPQYIQPLREEVEGIVEQEGWSKVAVDKMRKVDSFLKECLRFEGMLMASLSRKALKDFTFSDGTFIPKGTSVAVPSLSLHHDKTYYEDPDAFKPFRFAEIHDKDGNRVNDQLTSTSVEYLPFGHGRHACPGRFFAATELKLMLAHVVVTYDVKLEDNATYPPSRHIGTFITVNPRAEVVFRNRAD